MTENQQFEVIIIGGSYAGLSAAMSLGRSMRKVLILDNNLPCNRQTPYSHNFITQDGIPPAKIAAQAKEQVLRYPTITFVSDTAISGTKTNGSFLIATRSGKEYYSAKLIFATGIKDQLPDIPGFADCWGISVIHCPYCHGYEFKGQRTGIFADVAKAFHLATLVNNLTSDLTLIIPEGASIDTVQAEKLTRNGIKILQKEIKAVVHVNGQLSEIVFIDDHRIPLDALYAAIPFIQSSKIPENLGCALTESGHLDIDEFHRTNTDGIFACGDNTSPMRSVANAVYSGNFTGAIVNKLLSDESF
ncbi:NAD(P)/FAD-dependent oxidoreductase [Robertkochia solimangrovi]|uniref:NAD(P)/FAD-dependent oxidoreductase n=1 Tax=Robertkochia solimangrovi TaxID=2213046 RepID=UPI00117DF4FA|nr:NAD(P)/FAD-dependent oxidoreductase [Robertkochia solimangrovi]TRZ42249.1 NAD(P)/FAD-dependent oxidoreductase [Robertkochia solimangrovi]